MLKLGQFPLIERFKGLPAWAIRRED